MNFIISYIVKTTVKPAGIINDNHLFSKAMNEKKKPNNDSVDNK